MKNFVFIFAIMCLATQALYCQLPKADSYQPNKVLSVPDKVSLVFPTNNYTIEGEELTFLWNSSPTATHYKFDLLSDTTAMTKILPIPFLSDTTVTLPIVNYKDKATKLFWCVTAVNADGDAEKSEMWAMEFKPASVIEKLPEGIKIGPNPLSAELKINMPIEMDLQQLSIYDLSGRIIYTDNLTGKNQITIDTKEFPEGELLIKFEKQDKLFISRLIKCTEK